MRAGLTESSLNRFYLCSNTHPDAVAHLMENFDNIDWSFLSTNANPDAVRLLATNLDKIDWFILLTTAIATHWLCSRRLLLK